MFLLSDGDCAVARCSQNIFDEVLYLCPLLRIRCGLQQHLHRSSGRAIVRHCSLESMANEVNIELYLGRNTIESMSQQTRRMFLTQPAITAVNMHPASSGKLGRAWVVPNQHGITVDDFLDAATRIKMKYMVIWISFVSQHASAGLEFHKHHADDEHDPMCSSCAHIRAIRDEWMAEQETEQRMYVSYRVSPSQCRLANVH